MKKLITRIKNYHPCKPLGLLYLLIPVAISFFLLRVIDNDFWFLINQGRYILNHGFPIIEPFTIHYNFSFVIQQWLTDVIFYTIYHTFGHLGIILLLFVMTILIIYLLYKICILISNNRLGLSVIITLITTLILLTCYIRTRPQIFDFAILFAEIYFLEKYIKQKNSKYLLILPLLSLLLINLHASSWFMIFLFMLPYLIDSFKFKIGPFKGEGYNKKNLFLILIPMFLVGFINPYKEKAITYIFTSFGDIYVNRLVKEMQPMFKLGIIHSIIFFGLIALIIGTNIIKYKKIKVRYLCLQLGTLLLGIQSAKGFSFFLIGAIFSLAYYYKDNFRKYQSEYHYSKDFKLKYGLLVIIMIAIPLIISINIDDKNFNCVNVQKITDYLNKTENKSNVILFTDYDTGGYLEWNGYKTYLDPRAEVFLKRNNKKKDIIKEYYDLEKGKLDINKFLGNYHFTHLIVNKKSPLYKYLKDNTHYKLLYTEKSKDKTTYYLFKKVNNITSN